jgi:hypothetical protein
MRERRKEREEDETDLEEMSVYKGEEMTPALRKVYNIWKKALSLPYCRL